MKNTKILITPILMLCSIALIAFLLVIPYNVKATEIKSETLQDAFTKENIEYDFSNYVATDDQATIYLFWGNGCHYCHSLLEFLNSIIDEYGKYFKVETYETWHNQSNKNLLNEVSKFMDKPADNGVPYLIIGEETFYGYDSSFDEAIKNAIVKHYKSDVRYDALEEYEKSKSKQNVSMAPVVLTVIACTIVSTALILVYTNYRTNVVLERFADLETKIDNNSEKKKGKN